MADKKRVYTDEEIENMSSEDFERMQRGEEVPPPPKKEEKKPVGVRGYFAKQRKILEELDK